MAVRCHHIRICALIDEAVLKKPLFRGFFFSIERNTMKKIILFTLAILAFSSQVFACANHVNMSMPHVGELELIQSMRHAESTELKEIDLDQIFAGKLQKREPVFNAFKKDN